MAVDIAGFITDMKAHAVDHGFHVHAERHFIESFSLGQAWEVDLHPEEACEGPLEMLMVLEVEPRVILAFEDLMAQHLEMDEEQERQLELPLFFKWALPPLPNPPDLLILATELAGVSGTTLPVEVSATDTYMSVMRPAMSTAMDGASLRGRVRSRADLVVIVDRVVFEAEHAERRETGLPDDALRFDGMES